MTLTLEFASDTMDHPKSEATWDQDLATLLEDLSQVQEQLLKVLGEKRRLMAVGDVQGMAELQATEQTLADRLQQCHNRRGELLREAAADGLVAGTLGNLASTLKQRSGGDLRGQVKRASARMRLLQHQSLANWVLAQKALLHASQMLEIIATGGRLQSTYSQGPQPAARGALVDQEV